MLRRFRKGFWLVHLLTLTLCGFFAARAAGQYLGSKVASPEHEPVPVRHSVTPATVAETALRDTQAIVGRNIFCSTCGPIAPSEPERAESPSGQPTRTSLPLRLLATLITADGEEDGFAALLDTSSGRTRVAAVGERLALEARLIAVEERRILLENSGRKEFLPLEEAGAGPAKGAHEGPPKLQPAAAAAQPSMVRSVGAGRYEIGRDALNQTLSNTAALAAQARIIPAQLQGQPAGFMLTAIRPGSLYTQLGFQDGDIVQAVSGKQLRTVEDALQLMTALRTAQHVTISFQRHSRSITNDYTVTNR